MNVRSVMAAGGHKVLLWAALTLPLIAASAPASRPMLRPEYNKPPGEAQSCLSAELFSLRARRRAALLLRIQLQELRKAQLDRARAAVEGTLPLEDLLRQGSK